MSEAIPPNTLIVVADGGKAILFRSTGTGQDVTLQELRRLAPKDMVNDGPSGSRPEDQTPNQTGEATFVKQLVHTLTTMHHNGEFKTSIVVMDPQSLGQFRDAMGKSLEGTIIRTLSKDLTNNSLAEITKSVMK